MACAFRCSSNKVISAVKGNCLVASGIVGAYRATHDDHLCFVRFFHSQSVVSTEVEGTDIKTASLSWRNPSILHPDEFFKQLHHFIAIKIRHRQTNRSLLEPKSIALWSEHSDLSFLVFVGLGSFVALDPIVEP